jgi:hypothetical protein
MRGKNKCRPPIEMLEKRLLLSAASQSVTPDLAGLTVTSAFQMGAAVTSGQTINLGYMTASSPRTDTLTVTNNTGESQDLIVDDFQDPQFSDKTNPTVDLGISELGVDCPPGSTEVTITPNGNADNGTTTYTEDLWIGDPNSDNDTVFEMAYTFTIVQNGFSPNETLNLTSTPQTDTGTIADSDNLDSSGNNLLTLSTRLLYFTLTGFTNSINISADPAFEPNSDTDPTFLQVQLLRDTNANGLLDVAELNSPLQTWSATVGTNTQLTSNYSLSSGSYFVYVSGSSSNTHSFSVEDNVSISATSTLPPVAVFSYDGQTIPDSESSPSPTNGTSFGPVTVGSANVMHTFTVTNTGGSALQFTNNQSAPSPFVLNPQLTTSPIAPNGTATFTLDMTTGTAGNYTGDVTFATNIPDESTFQFEVSGQVTPPVSQPPAAVFTYDGQSIANNESSPGATNGTSFGSATINSGNLTHTFTVTNTGGSALQFTANQTASSPFLLSPLTTNPIAPGANATFNLILPTSTEGSYTGEVTLATNISGEPTFKFEVSGQVTAPNVPGYVDTANWDVISGWAWDPSHSTTAIKVEVDISNGPSQTFTASETRSDLQSVLGSSNHGFIYTTPMLSAGYHTASVYAVDVNGTKDLIATDTIYSENSLFDEHYYLQEYPNVAAAVANHVFATGYDHYVEYGQYEGYSPSPFWNEAWFLQNNPTAAAAVAQKKVGSGFMYYWLYDQDDPNGLLYFNTTYYLKLYPWLVPAIQDGAITSAYQHFIDFGQYEGLSPMLYFNPQVYDADNTDISAYVTGQPFTSDFEHFLEYGQFESRIASDYYNEQIYLEKNPDIAAAVKAGIFPDGFIHWLEYGQYEGRTAV